MDVFLHDEALPEALALGGIDWTETLGISHRKGRRGDPRVVPAELDVSKSSSLKV